MLALFLRYHFTTETFNLTVQKFRRGGEGSGRQCEVRGVERRTRGGDMLPMLAVGWQASALRGDEARRFREVTCVSIVAAGGPCLQ